MRITARATAPLLLALTIGVGACGGGDGDVEDAIEQAGGGNVDVDGDSVRVETEEGSFEMSSTGELPDDWPADVPLPDGFVVTAGSSVDGGAEGQLVAVSGNVAMTLDELDAFYADALDGWTEAARISSSSAGAPSLNVTYQVDDRMLSMGGVGRTGEVEVAFTYAYQPGTGSGETTGDAPDVDGGALGIDGADQALDTMGVEGIADAMVSALDADRYEMDGETVHIYLARGSRYDPMMGCIVAGSLIEDNPVVMHAADGSEQAC